MPDVHLFGYVRSRVVDGDGHRLNRGQAQFVISQRGFQLSGQPVRGEENIDKTGTGDFRFFRNSVKIQQFNHFLSELSGRHTHFFRGSHHTIGLVITKLRFGGLLNDSITIKWCPCADKSLLDLI